MSPLDPMGPLSTLNPLSALNPLSSLTGGGGLSGSSSATGGEATAGNNSINFGSFNEGLVSTLPAWFWALLIIALSIIAALWLLRG